MTFRKRTTRSQKIDDELLREIERVKLQMENAYTNFQCAMDPDLIDCYIYESNAAWKRYRFLLRLGNENTSSKSA